MIEMRGERDIKAEINAVIQRRQMLAGKSFRLKMFMARPLSKFLEPLLQFAHYMGQADMAKWILGTDDAEPGLIEAEPTEI